MPHAHPWRRHRPAYSPPRPSFAIGITVAARTALAMEEAEDRDPPEELPPPPKPERNDP